MGDRGSGGHTERGMDALFHPSSVAVIGASASPEKRGHQIVKALLEGGYTGTVVPVNPKGGRLLGLEVQPSLDEVETPDLAVVALPAAAVPDAVEDLAERGVPAAVVLAVGFGESGSEGRTLQQRLAEVARNTGIRVVGPNTSGLYNVHTGLNLIGTPGIAPGPIGIVTQSGNLALHLMRSITESGSGVSVCLGVGNQVDVGFSEALDYLAHHDSTRAVILYVEGVPDGATFIRSCAAASGRLPVVVLKSARSAAGQQAALSHTGALAGPYEVLRSALAQVGVTVVEREDELTPVVTALAHQPARREGVAILTDGGGQGTIACDRLADLGVPLATLAADTEGALRDLLGPAAAVTNPVDLAGKADDNPMNFAEALRLLLSDPGIGSVLVVGLFGGYHLRFSETLKDAEVDAAGTLAELARSAGRGLVVHTMYARSTSEPLNVLRRSGVPVVGSIEAACAAVGALQTRGRSLGLSVHPLADEPSPHRVRRARRSVGFEALSERRSREVLRDVPGLDVPFVPAVRCLDRESVATAVQEHASVVLKADVDGLAHKTELNGVELDVPAGEAASRAEAMLDRLEAAGHAHPAVLVQPMLAQPLAELLVSVRHEPDAGTVATVGAGGTWTEALADTAHLVLPCRSGAVVGALEELRVAARFTGARGRPASDDHTLQSLEDLVLRLGRFVASTPEAAEVELNPVFLYVDRLVAADALLVVEKGSTLGSGFA